MKYPVSSCVWSVSTPKERTNICPHSARPLKVDRRPTQTRMTALITPLNSKAPVRERKPAGGVLSRMNFGMGESKLATVMLKTKAMAAPMHCRKRTMADLNEKACTAGANSSELVFIATSLFLRISDWQRGWPKAEHGGVNPRPESSAGCH